MVLGYGSLFSKDSWECYFNIFILGIFVMVFGFERVWVMWSFYEK